MLTVKREAVTEKQDPNFQYGETQALVAVMVLVASFLGIVSSLMFHILEK